MKPSPPSVSKVILSLQRRRTAAAERNSRSLARIATALERESKATTSAANAQADALKMLRPIFPAIIAAAERDLGIQVKAPRKRRAPKAAPVVHNPISVTYPPDAT